MTVLMETVRSAEAASDRRISEVGALTVSAVWSKVGDTVW